MRFDDFVKMYNPPAPEPDVTTVFRDAWAAHDVSGNRSRPWFTVNGPLPTPENIQTLTWMGLVHLTDPYTPEFNPHTMMIGILPFAKTALFKAVRDWLKASKSDMPLLSGIYLGEPGPYRPRGMYCTHSELTPILDFLGYSLVNDATGDVKGGLLVCKNLVCKKGTP